jgi:hypothetical protein
MPEGFSRFTRREVFGAGASIPILATFVLGTAPHRRQRRRNNLHLSEKFRRLRQRAARKGLFPDTHAKGVAVAHCAQWPGKARVFRLA